jgi:hypothetical protein
MKPLDQLLTAIARDHLGIETLATRRSDDLDFHVVPVWGLRAALEAAHSGGAQSTWRTASELLEALEYVRATLKLRQLDEASDDEVEEALSIGRSALAKAKRLMPPEPDDVQPPRMADQTVPLSGHSAEPWAYEYNPYTVQRGDEPGVDLPAFEIFDAEGNKLFDTNEDMPSDVQEANARLASAAPELLAVLDRCAILLADYDEQDGEEGDAYRDAIAVITAATSGRREP